MNDNFDIESEIAIDKFIMDNAKYKFGDKVYIVCFNKARSVGIIHNIHCIDINGDGLFTYDVKCMNSTIIKGLTSDQLRLYPKHDL